MSHTPSYRSSSESTRSASPAESARSPLPSPRIKIPTLSETRDRACYSCGDIAIVRIDDDDGSEGKWACRDCQFIGPMTCEHCDGAKAAGKAAVCDCERIKPKTKQPRVTPPITPAPPMDETW